MELIALGGLKPFWPGPFGPFDTDGAPIRSVYLLQKAGQNRCEPLEPARAVKELFVRLIQPRLHATEVQRTLGVLEAIVERVPVAILHFQPTPAAFETAIRHAGRV